ncbi:MAG: hypothetical protein V4538_01570 [Bacteroidota bacterium]
MSADIAQAEYKFTTAPFTLKVTAFKQGNTGMVSEWVNTRTQAKQEPNQVESKTMMYEYLTKAIPHIYQLLANSIDTPIVYAIQAPGYEKYTKTYMPQN